MSKVERGCLLILAMTKASALTDFIQQRPRNRKTSIRIAISHKVRFNPCHLPISIADYLDVAWGKLATALGPSFEPYLPVIMPDLLKKASIRPAIQPLDGALE